MSVTLNSFAMRHWQQSGFTRTTLSPDALCELVEANIASAKPGYRDGVMLVEVSAETFETPLRILEDGDVVEATFSARRESEEAVIDFRHSMGYTPADLVEVVVYSHDTLGDDASTDAEWEIISLNASVAAHGSVPMNPVAMARNFLAKVGGTEAEYTAEQFADAIWFWATHSMGK